MCIEYLIKTTDYDYIIKCSSATGTGFILYPINQTFKKYEDAKGPAHYGLNNVSMNTNGSGALYDIGVAVGKNKAKSIAQRSTGADMWLWIFLYAFFPE